jgi:type IV pilus assembly protein PilM
MGLFRGQQEYFGIDIGSNGIRVVQLKRNAGKPALVTYGSIPVEGHTTISDAPADITRTAQLIKQLVKDARISTKLVVAGVPSNKVFASVITTPKLGPEELGKAIRLQADQYIPMALKDVKIDWAVLGPGANPEQQEVLLIAAPNSVTEKYLSIFQQADLELLALEPNAVALARAVVEPSDLAVMVLDMGTSTSDITIVHSNMPKLIRSVNVGGFTLVKSVAQNLGLDDAQAEQFTRKFGLTQTKLEGQVAKSLKPTLDILTSEIDKSVKFFSSQYPAVKLEKLLLTGGTTGLPELSAHLSTATGLKVEIANSWTKVSLQESLMGLSLEFGVAVGLAERDELA